MRIERGQIQALVEQGRMGEPQAQEALVRLAQNRVYYHCKKMLKNEADAQDATQDVLIVMLTSLDKLKEPAFPENAGSFAPVFRRTRHDSRSRISRTVRASGVRGSISRRIPR